jgi:tyrosyl-tRNA synthetase
MDAYLKSLDSKIDLLDPPEVVSKKVRKAVATPRVTDENGLLAFVEFVLLPAAALKGCKEFRVERTDGLEPLIYTDIKQMHDDYKNDVVCIYPTLPQPSGANCILVNATTAQACSVNRPC